MSAADKAALVPAGDLPRTEAEVIARLTIRPVAYKATVTVDDDTGSARHFVVLTYEFTGKLPAFGKFLQAVADDVWAAGGCVTSFNLNEGLGLEPKDRVRDDLDPNKPWQGNFLKAAIKTRAWVAENKAAWDAALKDLIGRHRQNDTD